MCHAKQRGRVVGFGLENLQEKKRVGRPRRRWDNNINVNLKNLWWGVELINLA